MFVVSENSYRGFSEEASQGFSQRCALFLMEQGLFETQDIEAATLHVESRVAPVQELGFRSEQAVSFSIAVELRAKRTIQSDPQLVERLHRLPEDESVRIDWFKQYVAHAPDWQL